MVAERISSSELNKQHYSELERLSRDPNWQELKRIEDWNGIAEESLGSSWIKK